MPRGGARRGNCVFLRLQPAVLLLPERAHLPGGGGETHRGRPPAGDFQGADFFDLHRYIEIITDQTVYFLFSFLKLRHRTLQLNNVNNKKKE